MICPKCGRDIEGNSCPYCDELKIHDRTQEYMARRARYVEENKDNNQSKDKVNKAPASSKKKVISRGFNRKKLVVPVGIISVGVLAAVLILSNMDFTNRKSHNQRLYYTSSGNVQRIDKKGSSLVAKSDEIVYSANRNALFTLSIPSDLRSKSELKLESFMTDIKGSIYAGTGYDSTDGVEKYVLYIWDNNGNYAKIADSKNMISLKFINEKKDILYTTTDVVNNVGGLGKIGLNLYKVDNISDKKAEGKNTLISNDISDVSVYEALNKVIYLNTDGNLYISDFSTPETRQNIAGSVSRFETENPISDNEFIKNENIINSSFFADHICYLDGNGWKLFNLINSDNINLASGNDTSANFIYDDKHNMIYKISGNGISVAKNILDNRDSGINYESLEKNFNQNSYLWFDDDYSLIYTNRSGELKEYTNKGNKTILSNVEDGSLLRVQNSNGYIFKSGNGLEFAKNAKSKPRLLTSDIGKVDEAGLYKRQLYMVINGELKGLNTIKSLGSKDGNLSDIGKCEEFWAGDN